MTDNKGGSYDAIENSAQQIWAAGHYLLLKGVPLQTNARFKELFQAIYV